MSVLDYIPCKGETFSAPSETVPNQAIPIRDIYRRYKAGTLPPIARQPFYDSSADPDDALSIDIDLVDKDEAFRRAQEIRKRIALKRQKVKNKPDLEPSRKVVDTKPSEVSKPPEKGEN